MFLFVLLTSQRHAFDRVNRNKLMDIMKNVRILFNEKRMVANLYWNQTAKVRYDNELTDDVTIAKGVKQGFVLLPVLFNLHIEMLITEALYEEEGIKMGGESITTIRCADDTAVVATTVEDLQRMMKKIRDTCVIYGMSLNAKMTKTMKISKFKNADYS